MKRFWALLLGLGLALAQAALPNWLRPGLVLIYQNETEAMGQRQSGTMAYLVEAVGQQWAAVKMITLTQNPPGLVTTMLAVGPMGSPFFVSPIQRQAVQSGQVPGARLEGNTLITSQQGGEVRITFDPSTGLVQSSTTQLQMGGQAMTMRVTYKGQAQVNLPALSLPPVAQQGAHYRFSMQGPMGPMQGETRYQPSTTDGNVALYQVFTKSALTGNMETPFGYAAGSPIEGPHYINPALLQGARPGQPIQQIPAIGYALVYAQDLGQEAVLSMQYGAASVTLRVDKATGLVRSVDAQTPAGSSRMELVTGAAPAPALPGPIPPAAPGGFPAPTPPPPPGPGGQAPPAPGGTQGAIPTPPAPGAGQGGALPPPPGPGQGGAYAPPPPGPAQPGPLPPPPGPAQAGPPPPAPGPSGNAPAPLPPAPPGGGSPAPLPPGSGAAAGPATPLPKLPATLPADEDPLDRFARVNAKLPASLQAGTVLVKRVTMIDQTRSGPNAPWQETQERYHAVVIVSKNASGTAAGISFVLEPELETFVALPSVLALHYVDSQNLAPFKQAGFRVEDGRIAGANPEAGVEVRFDPATGRVERLLYYQTAGPTDRTVMIIETLSQTRVTLPDQGPKLPALLRFTEEEFGETMRAKLVLEPVAPGGYRGEGEWDLWSMMGAGESFLVADNLSPFSASPELKGQILALDDPPFVLEATPEAGGFALVARFRGQPVVTLHYDASGLLKALEGKVGDPYRLKAR